jgi:signal peptidase I
VLALIIKAFLIQAFKIPSGSMLPTLLVGDHLFVNKFLYGLDLPFTDIKILAIRQPRRGDIIVFRFPDDPRRDFIKRIVAVGGDEIWSIDRKIFVNGRPLDEPYVQYTDAVSKPFENKRDNFGPLTVPEGKLFMMGDNRDNSHDSRFWGFVDLADVRGKAFIIYWSQEGNILHPRWRRIGNLID